MINVNRTVVCAEIGINFAYGDDISKFIDNAKLLIDSAAVAGFDYVKFQKRDPDLCVPEDQKNKPKTVPWRTEETTYLQYKKDIELSIDQYIELSKYAGDKGMKLFLSVWDIPSVDSAKIIWKEAYDDSLPIIKIPSALITDSELLVYAKYNSSLLMISTGMSTDEEIRIACEVCDPDVIFHTNSSYPSPVEELNLNYITYLKNIMPNKIIGYSGHEYGLTATFAAVVLGAQIIERHITLDRTNWGSDQLASVEVGGMMKLIKGIRDIEKAIGEVGPRLLSKSELEKKKSLRK